MNYFIADTHFGHKKVIEFNHRPFESVEVMNEALISNWNNKVHKGDVIYVLGDMFFRCENAEEILSQLKGRKRLLVGNHDGSWMTKLDAGKYFETIASFLEINDGKQNLTLCHYPLLTWNHAKRSYMIHGHMHDDKSFDFWPMLAARERVLNAGVDINGFVPVTLEELIENNRRFKKEKVHDEVTE